MIVVSMNLYLVLYILNIQYRIPISGYIKRYLHSIQHSTPPITILPTNNFLILILKIFKNLFFFRILLRKVLMEVFKSVSVKDIEYSMIVSYPMHPAF